jgi:hypothetical protein
MLVGGVALAQKGIAEPMPVVTAHQRLECRLVGKNVLLEGAGIVRVQVHMRVRVIAEWQAGGAPLLQDLDVLSPVGQRFGVDEAVSGRRLVAPQRLDDALRDVHAAHARRKRAREMEDRRT